MTLGKAGFRSKVYRLRKIQNVGEPGFVYIPSLVLEREKGKTLKCKDRGSDFAGYPKRKHVLCPQTPG